MAQRITRLTTDQKIAGSNPAVLDANIFFIFFLHFLETWCDAATLFQPRRSPPQREDRGGPCRCPSQPYAIHFPSGGWEEREAHGVRK